jgi:hypothetical protein
MNDKASFAGIADCDQDQSDPAYSALQKSKPFLSCHAKPAKTFAYGLGV